MAIFLASGFSFLAFMWWTTNGWSCPLLGVPVRVSHQHNFALMENFSIPLQHNLSRLQCSATCHSGQQVSALFCPSCADHWKNTTLGYEVLLLWATAAILPTRKNVQQTKIWMCPFASGLKIL
jgi:hypothetical protein